MTQNSDTHGGERIVVEVDEDLEDLIPGYLNNIRGDVEKMHNALNTEDYETIQLIGHSTKGSGGGYGFDAITDYGASLETAAENRNPEDIRKWLDKLAHFLDIVKVVYVPYE